jgi:hypothetical protein
MITYEQGQEKKALHQALKGRQLGWTPQPGSQEYFLMCPEFEVLYEGERGPGKTDALIMDFAQHVGKGWGGEWRGILFRQTFAQLSDVINKTLKWFPRMWPGAVYNRSDHTWTFPDGEQLLLRYMKSPEDYWNYHGHAYPWIGWEELTNWPTDECYLRMMSCCRSTVPGLPRKYRATTNPYGVGHTWVKHRFRLPNFRWRVITDSYREGKLEPPRVAIPGFLKENIVLLEADPGYYNRLVASARNKSELKAWTEGSWDIVAGGMFDDMWEPKHLVIPSFPIELIPRGWRIDRSFDWGSSAPFSVGWWAESNGEALEWEGRWFGTVRGDLIRIAEWYGSTGKPNEGVRMLATDIADGIIDREEDLGLKGRVKAGPADTSIFTEENGVCIAKDMQKQGVRWERADKGKGSRVQGWEQIRKRMKAALPNPDHLPREKPGLFVTDRCSHFIRTIPVLPRDDKNLDDIDTDAEDHIGDEVRYRVCRKVISVTQQGF